MIPKSIQLLIISSLLFQIQCKSIRAQSAYKTERLQITRISENSFIHVSYLDTGEFGKYACNGLLYLNNGEAAIFDTPADEATTVELLNWIQNELKQTVTAVIVNHFHEDCLGGLSILKEQGIPSFASSKTVALAKENGKSIPTIGFEESMEIEIGSAKIINKFFGEGHTSDNIVSYIPSEELLFGGCMIKSIDAKKGNLEDANINEWSHTVEKIKKEFPNLKHVVPGHGDYGNTELLDYTITLFKKG